MTHKHYVPILKTKAGEHWSLSGLLAASKPHITPLLEVVAVPDGRSLSDHFTAQCEKIVNSWGTTQPFYLDTRWLHPSHGDAVVIDSLFTTARAHSLQAVPVAYPEFSPASLSSVATVAATDGRGCLIRCTRETLNNPAVIPLVVTATRQPVTNLDFLLDYRGSLMSLIRDIPAVPNLAHWRRIAAASGIFPASLASLPQATWSRIDRNCWNGYLADVAGGSLSRIPCFSDYTIRDPGPPAGGGNPPVTMRYTADTYWLAQVHGTLQGGDAPNMYGMCADLITRPEWCGPAFSAGDRVIHQTALRLTTGPGGAPQWVQWAISHHIEFVVQRQLPTLP